MKCDNYTIEQLYKIPELEDVRSTPNILKFINPIQTEENC